MREEEKQVLDINKVLPFEDVKFYIKKIVSDINKELSELVFPFLVSMNKTLKGKVIYKQTNKTPYKLMSIQEVRKGPDEFKLRFSFLGDKKQLRKGESFKQKLYTYKFTTSSEEREDREEFTLLSVKQLPFDEIEIKGMAIPIDDKIKVGEDTKIEKGAELIYVTDFEPVVRSIDKKEFEKIIQPFVGDYNWLYKSYFSIYRHPKTFEKFLLSWLFASHKRFNTVGGYPSHFGWVGETGSGKTMIEECMRHIFNDNKVSPNATFKSLLPNFGGDRIDMGEYCKSNRHLLVEEFFRLVFKTKHGDNDFGLFNDLLEWQHNRVNSGKGTSIDGIIAKPTATMFWVSNFGKYKAGDFFSVMKDIDSAFLARNILYFQTQAHVKYVNKRKSNMVLNLDADSGDDTAGSCVLPNKNANLIELRDYLVGQKVKFGKFNPKEIYEDVKQILPDDINAKTVYRSRSLKHIVSIIDGITKVNYIVDGRKGPLKVTAKDFKDAHKIWHYIIYSWSDDIKRVPLEKREDYLTEKEYKIYKYFCNNLGQTSYNCEKEIGFYPKPQIDKLILSGLLNEEALGDSSSYSPYWVGHKEELDE